MMDNTTWLIKRQDADGKSVPILGRLGIGLDVARLASEADRALTF